jgi:hypothetical protein
LLSLRVAPVVGEPSRAKPSWLGCKRERKRKGLAPCYAPSRLTGKG